MGYRLEGDLLEVCNCEVLCPCWIGEDPDHGSCNSALAYRINSGAIGGIDVGGVVMASVVRIPGNVFAGGWRRQLYVDQAASDGQAGGGRRGDDGRARRADGRPRGAGRRGAAAAARRGGLRPARGPRPLRDRRDHRGGHGALPRPGRPGDDAARQRLLDDPGHAGLRRQGRAVPAAARRASASTSSSRATTRSRAASGSRRDRRGASSAAPSTPAGWRSPRSPGRALALWSASPWARYLEHGGLAPVGPPRRDLRRPRAGRPLRRRLGADARGDDAADDAAGALAARPRRLAPPPPGAAWSPLRSPAISRPGRASGSLAHLADAGLLAAARGSGWLAFNGWAVGAGVLALAGAFQFSGLKRRCLDRCRSPLALVMQHWRGRRPLARGLAARPRAWRLLRRLLLGADADHVRRRHRQRRLDAAARARHGGGEEPPWGRGSSAPLGAGLLAWSAAIGGAARGLTLPAGPP